jgi:molybdate transport system ATP-binding protein
VVLGGRTLADTARGVYAPAHQRGVRSAGQTARLFPGMTVRENLRYGMGKDDRALENEVLRLFRMEGLAAKRPVTLSGGEQQRVSVARAVVSAAITRSLLLLDEPFSGLDMALRDGLAIELRTWLAAQGVTVLSVTHDVGEVFLLGAEVVRIADGRIVDQGPAERVLAGERDRLLGQLRG